jgi:hypothetical protein
VRRRGDQLAPRAVAVVVVISVVVREAHFYLVQFLVCATAGTAALVTSENTSSWRP